MKEVCKILIKAKILKVEHSKSKEEAEAAKYATITDKQDELLKAFASATKNLL